MENDNLENIFLHAWNRDAVNLRTTLDAELQHRVSASMDNMVGDISASLFVPTGSSEENDAPVEDNTDI